MNKDLFVVILAAGKGTRMRSSLPKVLHPLAGYSLLEHVIHTAFSLKPKEIRVVYGHGGEIVPETLSHLDVKWVKQEEQLGTGHAVKQALPDIPDEAEVLVLYGDVPLTYPSTLSELIKTGNGSAHIALLTAVLDNPMGYGRIIRNQKQDVTHIVEQKDANDAELLVNEVNTGILSAPSDYLNKWLNNLSNNNAQGEYYLTDIISMAVQDGLSVDTHSAENEYEMLGVNDKLQLANLERQYQLLQAENLMREGVTLRDPARIDVRGTLSVGQDVVIDVNCLFEGDVSLGEGVSIGPNCVLKDVSVSSGTVIKANSVLENARIGAGCHIGPFARIRPETELADHVHIGNFVEIKKAIVSEGSKINHLSYVGDAKVGKCVNIGAGTITCNYDGANKYLTEIGDNAFIGSDSQLVAPVKVGAGATIGAGSTITKDTADDKLTLSRSKQITLENWTRPTKK